MTRIPNLLIVGAGDAGQRLAAHLSLSYRSRYRLVGFIDDDVSKHGACIEGLPVLGGRALLRRFVEELDIDEIVVAIPSASADTRKALLHLCTSTSARLRAIPSLDEILSGKGSVHDLRDITIEDLLGRTQVNIDLTHCRHYIAGKQVMVVGAAGSVGAELVRQLIGLGPSKLLLADINESGLFDLEQDLLEAPQTIPFELCILDVTLADKVDALFELRRPQVVFHAAAFKHVPLMERYPEEAIRVNVLGTINLCLSADKYGVDRFVFISTDKAVNAVSVMGATKRLAEKVVSGLGGRGATTFCSVRFGNVFGSRGSVGPLFERQIERGGPVTVTNPSMTRYFMALAEAAGLVLQAGALAHPGDIFVLDMGEPVRIDDLAKKMIRARGLRVGEDIQIVYTRARPGERIHEKLLHEHEQVEPTTHRKVLRISSSCTEDWETLKSQIDDLRSAISSYGFNDRSNLVRVLFELARVDGQKQSLPSLHKSLPRR